MSQLLENHHSANEKLKSDERKVLQKEMVDQIHRMTAQHEALREKMKVDPFLKVKQRATSGLSSTRYFRHLFTLTVTPTPGSVPGLDNLARK